MKKWGEVVVAYVQARPGVSVDPSEWKALCARSLTGYKRPTSFIVVEAIAKNAVGKITRPRCGQATRQPPPGPRLPELRDAPDLRPVSTSHPAKADGINCSAQMTFPSR